MYPFSFKPAVHRGCDDPDFGMLGVHALDSLRRGDETDERDRAGAGVLDLRDRRDARVPRREHRVEHDRVAVLEVVRQLDVVLDRLERLLVAVQADEPDPRAGDERQHPVEHPHPGAEHRADGDLFPGDALHGRPLERRLDLDVLGREVLRRLVGQEQRDLVRDLAEVHRRRVLLA